VGRGFDQMRTPANKGGSKEPWECPQASTLLLQYVLLALSVGDA